MAGGRKKRRHLPPSKDVEPDTVGTLLSQTSQEAIADNEWSPSKRDRKIRISSKYELYSLV